MISVIIPTLNAERDLVPTLAALVPGVTGGVLRDVILADGGSNDDTAAIADAAGCVLLAGERDVGARLRQGAAQGRGRWLLFLGTGSVLEEGWVREVGTFMEMAERRDLAARAAATFRLSRDGYGVAPRIADAMSALRLAMLGRPHPGQGLLIAKPHYDRLGGHPAGDAAERRFIGRLGRSIHVLRAQVRMLGTRSDAGGL
ncbi:glycosyltransferase [Aquabacter spiritensis]|uniref:Glycosyl transferase family 2 n=1 Tax=Aquabacter spiritensis TaxID=933073 RepID=A0A4R3LYY7_9HYPH|nr:glycosyltransferase [Aquabacter spiritensis]TCT05693.1 glycosyl transferase family 2 [Aquabacter spiritensis]